MSKFAFVKKKPGMAPVMRNSSTLARTVANVAPGGRIGSNVIGSSSPKPIQPGGRVGDVGSSIVTEKLVQSGCPALESAPSVKKTPDGPLGPMMSRSTSAMPTSRAIGWPKKLVSWSTLTSNPKVTWSNDE
jgi:hypothetical protein